MNLAIDGGKGTIYEKGRKGDWMQTFTGIRYYPLDPKVEDIDILDIVQALSTISRYNGHCRFYSVAEHSVLVSHLVPDEHKLTALFHDATEAYTGDMTRPMKRALKASGENNPFFEIEQLNWEVIADKFGLPKELPECVHKADVQLLGLEREVLHPRADEWDIPFDVPRHLKIHGYMPHDAAKLFVERMAELVAEAIGIPEGEEDHVIGVMERYWRLHEEKR